MKRDPRFEVQHNMANQTYRYVMDIPQSELGNLKIKEDLLRRVMESLDKNYTSVLRGN